MISEPVALRKWLLDDVVGPVLRPKSRMELREWMEENLSLRATESPERAGPYSGADTLPVTRLLWMFWTTPSWRELAVQKCSQSGLTMHVLALLLRMASEDPRNFVYAIDSKVEVRNISRRFRHFLEDCPLTAEMFEDADSDGDVTKTEVELPGMIGWFIGAGSAGGFANKTASIGIGDELNKHPVLPGEPPTTALLRARLKTITQAKLFFYSTPTTEDGAITVEYEAGSRHQYHVPCPHCGHFQVLKWEGFKFTHCKDLAGFYDLERVLKETYYECAGCAGHIREEHKRAMVEAAEWRPTNFREEDDLLSPGGKRLVPNFAPDRMSAKLPEYFSFHTRSTWGHLAVEWVQALGKPGKIHEHVTDRQAEAFKNTPSEVSADVIMSLRGDYDKSTLPWTPCFAALISDVQGDVCKWARVGFRHNGDMAVADWGMTLSVDELEEIADLPILTPEKSVVCQRVMIDEGHRTFEMRQFCYPRFPRFMTCKGRGGIQVRDITVIREGRLEQAGTQVIPVLHFSDDDFKRELYIRRIAKFDAGRAEAYGQPRLWLPRQLDPAFVRELCGERLERTMDHGRIKWEWVPSPPNDWGDCLKMGLVLWSMVGAFFDQSKKAAAPADDSAG